MYPCCRLAVHQPKVCSIAIIVPKYTTYCWNETKLMLALSLHSSAKYSLHWQIVAPNTRRCLVLSDIRPPEIVAWPVSRMVAILTDTCTNAYNTPFRRCHEAATEAMLVRLSCMRSHVVYWCVTMWVIFEEINEKTNISMNIKTTGMTYTYSPPCRCQCSKVFEITLWKVFSYKLSHLK